MLEDPNFAIRVRDGSLEPAIALREGACGEVHPDRPNIDRQHNWASFARQGPFLDGYFIHFVHVQRRNLLQDLLVLSQHGAVTNKLEERLLLVGSP